MTVQIGNYLKILDDTLIDHLHPEVRAALVSFEYHLGEDECTFEEMRARTIGAFGIALNDHTLLDLYHEGKEAVRNLQR